MKRLLFLISLLSLTGCIRADIRVYNTRAFVMGYQGMNRIYITQGNTIGDKKLYYHVNFSRTNERWGIFFEDGRDYYEELCEKHNDTYYNRRVEINHSVVGPTPWLRCARDFVGLEVWSSADWDAEHPAGTSLNDLTRFSSETPWPYIRSGYVEKYSDEKDGEYYPIDKLVAELTPDDMTLLPEYGFRIAFKKLAAEHGKHTLFVRLTADDGTVFEASEEAEF